MQNPLQASVAGPSGTASRTSATAASSTNLQHPPSNARLLAPADAALQYQGSVIHMQDNVSAEDIDFVRGILRNKKYPESHKEGLIFEVNYYIPRGVVSFEDRPEFVAKAVVELQNEVPMNGMLYPEFPRKVHNEYLRRVIQFLRLRGKRWVETMLQPTSRPSSDTASTLSIPSTGPVRQAVEEIAHPSPYAPDGDGPIVSNSEAGFDDMEMVMVEESTTIISNRLVPDSLLADGTIFDADERYGVRNFGRGPSWNRFFCFGFGACLFVLFLWLMDT